MGTKAKKVMINKLSVPGNKKEAADFLVFCYFTFILLYCYLFFMNHLPLHHQTPIHSLQPLEGGPGRELTVQEPPNNTGTVLTVYWSDTAWIL